MIAVNTLVHHLPIDVLQQSPFNARRNYNPEQLQKQKQRKKPRRLLTQKTAHRDWQTERMQREQFEAALIEAMHPALMEQGPYPGDFADIAQALLLAEMPTVDITIAQKFGIDAQWSPNYGNLADVEKLRAMTGKDLHALCMLHVVFSETADLDDHGNAPAICERYGVDFAAIKHSIYNPLPELEEAQKEEPAPAKKAAKASKAKKKPEVKKSKAVKPAAAKASKIKTAKPEPQGELI